MSDFVTESKQTPNLAKSSQAGPKKIKENQRKKLGFPLIVFADSGFFNGLRRPPKAKKLFPAPYLPFASSALAGLHSSIGDRVSRFPILAKKIP
jgi:hypothetical protein